MTAASPSSYKMGQVALPSAQEHFLKEFSYFTDNILHMNEPEAYYFNFLNNMTDSQKDVSMK